MPKSLPKMLAPALLPTSGRVPAALTLAVRAQRATSQLAQDAGVDQEDWRLQGQIFSQDEVLRFAR